MSQHPSFSHTVAIAIVLFTLAFVSSCNAIGGGVYYNATVDQSYQHQYYIDFINAGSVTAANLTALLQKTHAHQYSYDEARAKFLYPIVDRQVDGTLVGVYTNKTLDQPRRFKVSVNDISYNCEHVVPQSWFNKQLPMRGDLHHLFTAEPKCNSIRSNHPYGICEPMVKVWEGCGTLYSDCFYPLNNRGPVSRAVLYFLVRYPGMLSIKDMPKASLMQVVDWAKVSNKKDISLWELHRNFEIFQIQGNRNPFIDNPEWIDAIDFNSLMKH